MADRTKTPYTGAEDVIIKRGASYKRGFKYCKGCEVWFKTKSLRCPYCGRILKERARVSRVDPKKYLGRGWEKKVKKVKVRKKEGVEGLFNPRGDVVFQLD